MSNKVFKNSGLQIAESKDGDILIYNKSLKVETIIYREFWEAATDDGAKAVAMARKLAFVLEANTNGRWGRVIVDAEKIKKSGERGRALVVGLRSHFEARNHHSLRKIEKDFYFFQKSGELI